jgi:hypothetical protein
MQLPVSLLPPQLPKIDALMALLRQLTAMPTVGNPAFPAIQAEDHIVGLLLANRADHLIWEVDQEALVASALPFHADVAAQDLRESMICLALYLERLSRVVALHGYVPYMTVDRREGYAGPTGDLPEGESVRSKLPQVADHSLVDCHFGRYDLVSL